MSAPTIAREAKRIDLSSPGAVAPGTPTMMDVTGATVFELVAIQTRLAGPDSDLIKCSGHSCGGCEGCG
jgi:hypothetical protein